MTSIQVIAVARREIGTIEGPNNYTKYGVWYGLPNAYWCMMFVQWCFYTAGQALPKKSASCGDLLNWYLSNHKDWVHERPFEGAIVVYKEGHTGIVSFVSTDGVSFKAIEGNTSSSGSTSSALQANGDGVYEKNRTLNKNSYMNVKAFIDPFGTFAGRSADYGTFKPEGSRGGAVSESSASKIEYETKSITISDTRDEIRTVEQDLDRTRSVSLLSYPSLVESPFITFELGEYTFGSYVPASSTYSSQVAARVTYPNYMSSIDIVKINGTVNQYTLKMVYQIEAGNDPNLLDKIFSSVGYGTAYISYGDWSSPSFIYKREEVIITKVTSNVDFVNSRIIYTVLCTSNALALMSGNFNFPAMSSTKPSSVIYSLLQSSSTYGLNNIFTGMKNLSVVRMKGLIPTDDLEVDIPSKQNIDVLSYLNFLVTCMCSNTNSVYSVIQDSSYYLTIHDDLDSELGGTYFKITKVMSASSTLNTIDTYEIDVGYPGDTFVTSFSLKDDNSWALLYNYANKVDIDNGLSNNSYVYKIDDDGKLLTEYSPNITTSSTYYKTTQTQKSWWTQMTQFPVSASLTIKGLVRPAMLMTYVRINAMFYGQRHVSSGLYIVTKQQDTVDSRGYRTTLNLTRIAGDQDYIVRNTRYYDTEVKIRKDSTGSSASASVNNKNLSASVPKYAKTFDSGNTYTSDYWNVEKMTEGQISAVNHRIQGLGNLNSTDYQSVKNGVDSSMQHRGAKLVGYYVGPLTPYYNNTNLQKKLGTTVGETAVEKVSGKYGTIRINKQLRYVNSKDVYKK